MVQNNLRALALHILLTPIFTNTSPQDELTHIIIKKKQKHIQIYKDICTYIKQKKPEEVCKILNQTKNKRLAKTFFYQNNENFQTILHASAEDDDPTNTLNILNKARQILPEKELKRFFSLKQKKSDKKYRTIDWNNYRQAIHCVIKKIFEGKATIDTIETAEIMMQMDNAIHNEQNNPLIRFVTQTTNSYITNNIIVGSKKYLIQRINTPNTSQPRVIGDLHGNIPSLNHFFKQEEIAKRISSKKEILDKENTFYIFTGDYVDRQPGGLIVLQKILSFKLKNPDNVFILRGNHEDANININYKKNSIYKELQTKYKDRAIQKMYTLGLLYNLLPVNLNLVFETKDKQKRFIPFFHGGPEPRHDIQKFLTSEKQFEVLDTYKTKNEAITNLLPIDVGYLWNDIATNKKDPTQHEPGRGTKFCKKDLLAIQNQNSSDIYKQTGFFRGHQHGDKQIPNSVMLIDDPENTNEFQTTVPTTQHKLKNVVACTTITSKKLNLDDKPFYTTISLDPDYEKCTVTGHSIG